MQSQVMWLEINLGGSFVFEYRPNSRPERCKYNYLYFFICGFCWLWQHPNLKRVFTATSFKILEHQVRQHNTTRWNIPFYPNYSSNKNRMQSFITWPAGSKQKPQDLSNAGFFYQGKVHKYKSMFIIENHFLKPWTNVYMVSLLQEQMITRPASTVGFLLKTGRRLIQLGNNTPNGAQNVFLLHNWKA
jgi:hypothetical protein